MADLDLNYRPVVGPRGVKKTITPHPYVPASEPIWLRLDIDGGVDDGESIVLAKDAADTIRVPFAGTITNVTMISREEGATVEIDLKAGAAFSSVASMVGAGGTKPKITSGQTAEVTAFTGWTSVAVAKDAYLQAVVTSNPPTAAKHLTVLVQVTRAVV